HPRGREVGLGDLRVDDRPPGAGRAADGVPVGRCRLGRDPEHGSERLLRDRVRWLPGDGELAQRNTIAARGETHPLLTHAPLCSLERRGAFVYACDMAKNMTGVEMRPTPAGRKALEEGRYEDVAALPSRMKQYRVARRVDGQRIRTPFCATAALAEEDFAERLEQARRGTKVDAATARLLVGQYAERWIKRRHGLV